MTNSSAGAGRDGSRLREFIEKWTREASAYVSGAMFEAPVGDMNRASADVVRKMLTDLKAILAVPDPLASDTGQGASHGHRFKYQIAIRAMVCRCGFRINEDEAHNYSEHDTSAPLASSSAPQGEKAKNETTKI